MCTCKLKSKSPAGSPGNFNYVYTCTKADGSQQEIKVSAGNDNEGKKLAELECEEEKLADLSFDSALTFAQVRQKVISNNNSLFSTELIVAICWAESTFKPDSKADDPRSTSQGLMMMNKAAVDTVNDNTPAGIRFSHADMLDADKAIACGSWYLRIIYTKPDWNAQGNQRETLRVFRGRPDYVYVDKVLSCEGCLQSTVVTNPQVCLNQIHTFV
jgi:hypothetical protein